MDTTSSLIQLPPHSRIRNKDREGLLEEAEEMPTNTQPQHRDKPIVYALDPLQPSAQALAEKHFRLRIRANADDNEWQAHAEGILVRGSYVTARDLEGATRLRFIAKHGVGVDKIDVPMAKRLGIRVMNTPGVNVSTI
jgi:phosphoglycerate dehydrogenase-like enzyme